MSSVGSVLANAVVLLDLAGRQRDRGDLLAAIDSLNKFLESIENKRSCPETERFAIPCITSKVEMLLKLKLYEKVIKSANIALSIPSVTLNNPCLCSLYMCKSKALGSLKLFRPALETLDQALAADEGGTWDDSLREIENARTQLVLECARRKTLITVSHVKSHASSTASSLYTNTIPSAPQHVPMHAIQDLISFIKVTCADPASVIPRLRTFVAARPDVDRRVPAIRCNVLQAICEASIDRASLAVSTDLDSPAVAADDVCDTVKILVRGGARPGQRFGASQVYTISASATPHSTSPPSETSSSLGQQNGPSRNVTTSATVDGTQASLAGVDVTKLTRDDWEMSSPLHLLSFAGAEQSVRYLVSPESDVSGTLAFMVDADGWTPLMASLAPHRPRSQGQSAVGTVSVLLAAVRALFQSQDHNENDHVNAGQGTSQSKMTTVPDTLPPPSAVSKASRKAETAVYKLISMVNTQGLTAVHLACLQNDVLALEMMFKGLSPKHMASLLRTRCHRGLSVVTWAMLGAQSRRSNAAAWVISLCRQHNLPGIASKSTKVESKSKAQSKIASEVVSTQASTVGDNMDEEADDGTDAKGEEQVEGISAGTSPPHVSLASVLLEDVKTFRFAHLLAMLTLLDEQLSTQHGGSKSSRQSQLYAASRARPFVEREGKKTGAALSEREPTTKKLDRTGWERHAQEEEEGERGSIGERDAPPHATGLAVPALDDLEDTMADSHAPSEGGSSREEEGGAPASVSDRSQQSEVNPKAVQQQQMSLKSVWVTLNDHHLKRTSASEASPSSSSSSSPPPMVRSGPHNTYAPSMGLEETPTEREAIRLHALGEDGAKANEHANGSGKRRRSSITPGYQSLTSPMSNSSIEFSASSSDEDDDDLEPLTLVGETELSTIILGRLSDLAEELEFIEVFGMNSESSSGKNPQFSIETASMDVIMASLHDELLPQVLLKEWAALDDVTQDERNRLMDLVCLTDCPFTQPTAQSQNGTMKLPTIADEGKKKAFNPELALVLAEVGAGEYLSLSQLTSVQASPAQVQNAAHVDTVPLAQREVSQGSSAEKWTDPDVGRGANTADAAGDHPKRYDVDMSDVSALLEASGLWDPSEDLAGEEVWERKLSTSCVQQEQEQDGRDDPATSGGGDVDLPEDLHDDGFEEWEKKAMRHEHDSDPHEDQASGASAARSEGTVDNHDDNDGKAGDEVMAKEEEEDEEEERRDTLGSLHLHVRCSSDDGGAGSIPTWSTTVTQRGTPHGRSDGGSATGKRRRICLKSALYPTLKQLLVEPLRRVLPSRKRMSYFFDGTSSGEGEVQEDGREGPTCENGADERSLHSPTDDSAARSPAQMSSSPATTVSFAL